MAQQRPKPGDPPGRGPDVGEYAGVGLAFAASIALFLVVGMWADKRFGTEPWLMIAGVVVGASAGFWSMYRQLVVEPRERERKDRDP